MRLFAKILLLIFTLFITVDGSSVTARKPLTQAAANDLVDNDQWLDYMRNNRLSNAELGRIGAAFVYKGHEQFMYSPQVDFAVTTLSSLTGITEGVIMLSSFTKTMILRLIAKKAAKKGMSLAMRSDIILSGGRSGQLVKNLTGPANSVLRGNGNRIFITDDAGKVIWDVTKDRAKSVIPGQGFGPKVTPTQQQLDLLNKIWGN